MPVPAHAAPKLCLRLWTQLGESLCLSGFCNSLWSTCLPTSQANRLIFPRGRPQIQAHTALLEGREGGREHHLLKVRFWQLPRASTASASTGMRVELNPAYLKPEGKGCHSGRPTTYSPCLLPFLFWVCFRLKAAVVWSNWTKPLERGRLPGEHCLVGQVSGRSAVFPWEWHWAVAQGQ